MIFVFLVAFVALLSFGIPIAIGLGGSAMVYLLFNPDLILAALRAARSAGARVSLDLASYNVVAQSRDFLADIVREYVDILIANEDEARAFTGRSLWSILATASSPRYPCPRFNSDISELASGFSV